MFLISRMSDTPSFTRRVIVRARPIGLASHFTPFLTSMMSKKLCATNSRSSSYFCQVVCSYMTGQVRCTCVRASCNATFVHLEFLLCFLQNMLTMVCLDSRIYKFMKGKSLQKTPYLFIHSNKTVKLPVLASLTDCRFFMVGFGVFGAFCLNRVYSICFKTVSNRTPISGLAVCAA